ncbi:MAG: hypothetical protein HY687_04330 [Chloroflexi bacterium]|nr:hypothetical protein [Chloroflexota bacterium]
MEEKIWATSSGGELVAKPGMARPEAARMATEQDLARQEVRHRIKETTALVIAVLLTAAVGLSLSVLFLAGGILAAALVIPVVLVGILAYYLVPPLLVRRHTMAK